VLAIDIPSGLNGETGEAVGEAIRADWTVTMGLVKTGMVRGRGLDLCGRITVADLGFPADLVREIESDQEVIDSEELARLLPPRRTSSHKGDYGRLLLIAGSPGMTGAAALAARAALRAGAGLVTVAVPRSLAPILEGLVVEAMTLPLPETPEGTISPEALGPILKFCVGIDAVALGPGISRDRGTGRLVRSLVRRCPAPLIIDADGLNLIARHPRVLKKSSSSLILTPHPGEMSRLTGQSKEELLADREGAALGFARKYNLTLVLKGAGTLIAAPSGPLWINLSGNPGMATGGSGDILTGLIAGLRVQGLNDSAAARIGVLAHGLAGDRAARRRGMMGMLPSDLLEEIPAVFNRLFPRNLPPAG
jgi:NAD(P)H-hydrate epimerase